LRPQIKEIHDPMSSPETALSKPAGSATVRSQIVESKIRVFRDRKVILDSDLAELYGVESKRLNEQVKRNAERFPEDFVFQLSAEEFGVLRSQTATSTAGRGGRRYQPYAFTEHGAIMAASVLNSPRAVEMSIFVVRAFVRMREARATSQQIAAKLSELEQKLERHDTEIQTLIDAIKELMDPPAPVQGKIGFAVPSAGPKALSGEEAE
jgi:phage regulator Rha-like protein